MSWVFISIIIFTIIQLVACHGLKWLFLAFLITLIARILFLGRLIGATVKVKSLAIAEAFSAGMLFLFNLLSKSATDWPKLLGYIVISAICCLIMFIDDTFYLYVTEDVSGKDDDDND